MRVGYVRCSTAEQNEARQLKMMEAQKVEKVFINKASGKIEAYYKQKEHCL